MDHGHCLSCTLKANKSFNRTHKTFRQVEPDTFTEMCRLLGSMVAANQGHVYIHLREGSLPQVTRTHRIGTSGIRKQQRQLDVLSN